MTYSILIVDDNAFIRRSLHSWLGKSQLWRVCGEAADGREAIAKAQQLRPDLIILDLSMPEMNGLDAARELTKILPSVPLLLFTNFETPEISKEALAAGFRAVVPKSDPSLLLASIKLLLATTSSRAAPAC